MQEYTGITYLMRPAPAKYFPGFKVKGCSIRAMVSLYEKNSLNLLEQ